MPRLASKPIAMNHDDARRSSSRGRRGKKMTGPGALRPGHRARDLPEWHLGDPAHVESCFLQPRWPFGAALLGDGKSGPPAPGKFSITTSTTSPALEFWMTCPPSPRSIPSGAPFGDTATTCSTSPRRARGRRVSLGTFLARPPRRPLLACMAKNTAHADLWIRTVTLDASAKLPSAIGRVTPAFDQALEYLREGGKNVLRFAKSEFHFFSGLNQLIRLFYDSITTGSDLPISYRDILRVTAMMDEIFRQVPQGRASAS
jgi:hypothetical protein